MLPEVRSSSEVYGETEPALLRRARSRSRATRAISRPPSSARPASRPGRPRTPTARAASCCSTPARSPCPRRTACSRPWGGRSAARRHVLPRGLGLHRGRRRAVAARRPQGDRRPRPRSSGLAATVPDSDGVYLVPGVRRPRRAVLGPVRARPHHRPHAQHERRPHRARDRGLDGLPDARRPRAMQQDAGLRLDHLKVDGGAAANDALLQFQADLLGVPVRRPVVAETTALGAAYLAGLAVGYWKDRRRRAQLGARPRVHARHGRRRARVTPVPMAQGRRARARVGGAGDPRVAAPEPRPGRERGAGASSGDRSTDPGRAGSTRLLPVRPSLRKRFRPKAPAGSTRKGCNARRRGAIITSAVCALAFILAMAWSVAIERPRLAGSQICAQDAASAQLFGADAPGAYTFDRETGRAVRLPLPWRSRWPSRGSSTPAIRDRPRAA